MFFKSKFLTLATTIALACSAVACGGGDDEDNDYYYPYEPGGSTPSPSLVASPNSLIFSGKGEEKAVSLSNVSGSVSFKGPDWVLIAQSSGNVYTITALPNPESRARSGYTYFETSYSSVAVTLYQNPGSSQGGNQGGNSGDNPDPNPGNNTNSAPSAPTGLRASADGPSSAPFALLNWNSVSKATSYIVYRSNSAYGSYSKIGTSTVNGYSDESVKYGNTYYYKVKASNSYGTSDYSDYAVCEFTDRRKPGPVTYGNCTVSGTTMTLRWSVPKDPSYGTPTKAILRVRNPDSGKYADIQTLSGTATSVSFAYTPWVDKEGYVYAGIILENENGTGGGVPKIYDAKNKRWMN